MGQEGNRICSHTLEDNMCDGRFAGTSSTGDSNNYGFTMMGHVHIIRIERKRQSVCV